MSDVPIQVVDKHDKPVGSASKEQVWREGLIHRIVRVIILDKTGRLLVQKRSKQKALYPGRWDNSAAGHVDAGETYEQAVKRELKEELGLENVHLEQVDQYYIEKIEGWRQLNRFTRSYKIVLDDPLPDFVLSEDEVELIEWMDINKVKELVNNHPDQVSDGLGEVIHRYFS